MTSSFLIKKSQTVLNFCDCNNSIIFVKILPSDVLTPNRISITLIVMKLLIFIKLRLTFSFSDKVASLVTFHLHLKILFPLSVRRYEYELMQEKHNLRVRETQSPSKCAILVNLSKIKLYILK